jgi:hypothetical protein
MSRSINFGAKVEVNTDNKGGRKAQQEGVWSQKHKIPVRKEPDNVNPAGMIIIFTNSNLNKDSIFSLKILMKALFKN